MGGLQGMTDTGMEDSDQPVAEYKWYRGIGAADQVEGNMEPQVTGDSIMNRYTPPHFDAGVVHTGIFDTATPLPTSWASPDEQDQFRTAIQRVAPHPLAQKMAMIADEMEATSRNVAERLFQVAAEMEDLEPLR